MGSFLLRLSAGEYEVDCELQLKKLLTSILKNKFQMLLRREMAAKRDRNRTKSFEDQGTIADPHAVEPRDSISIQELQQQAFAKLTDHEKQLLKLRMEGLSWELIAQRLELDERLLRKRLSRAINRVSLELGLIPDDEPDEQQ
jgi:RNA polymerase sigma factor (sigma-70 family)